MKRRCAGVLVALFVLIMGAANVYAAESPSAEAALKQLAATLADNVTDLTASTSNAGTSVTLSKESISTENLSEASYLAHKYDDRPELLASVELKTTASNATLQKGIKLKLTVSGVKSGDNLYVFHKLASGEWEIIKPSVVSAGYLEMKLYSLSPVVVVRYNANVSIVPSEQDNSAELLEANEIRARSLAKNVTGGWAIASSNAMVTLTRGTVSVSNLLAAEALASAMGSNPYTMAAVEISTSASAVTVAGGLTVTLNVPEVKTGNNVYVLHRFSDGSWEKIKPSVGTGTVTFKLTSLSPIVIFRYPDGTAVEEIPGTSTGTPTGGDQNNNQSQNNSQSNPQTNNQTNDNNQSNSQTNNQNNPVNVNQEVTVNYPENPSDKYKDGYSDGFTDGYQAGKDNKSNSSGASSNAGSGNKTGNSSMTAPKTGASLPVLPYVAMIAAAGLAVCCKKSWKSNKTLR